MMGMNVITLSDVAFLADYEPIWGFCLDRNLTDDPQNCSKYNESDWI